jgi:hypothetical protein
MRLLPDVLRFVALVVAERAQALSNPFSSPASRGKRSGSRACSSRNSLLKAGQNAQHQNSSNFNFLVQVSLRAFDLLRFTAAAAQLSIHTAPNTAFGRSSIVPDLPAQPACPCFSTL